MRAPRFGNFRDSLFERATFGPKPVELLHGHLNAQIVGWKNIGAVQIKHQNHFNRPPPHTANGGKMSNNSLVRHALDALSIKSAAARKFRHALEIADLLPRDARAAQLGFGHSKQAGGVGITGREKIKQPLVNGVGSLDGKLL